LSIETLTGGRIRTIAHMTQLLSSHPEFTWANYGDEWEIDHVTPFELMDKSLVSDRFKLNNWSNLAPRTSEQNKKLRQLKLDAARLAQTEAAGAAETEAARPTEPESLGY
jgi:hypothetical protein